MPQRPPQTNPSGLDLYSILCADPMSSPPAFLSYDTFLALVMTWTPVVAVDRRHVTVVGRMHKANGNGGCVAISFLL